MMRRIVNAPECKEAGGWKSKFDVEIHGKYHDEFFGFCGKFEIKEGKMSVEDDSDGEEAKAYLRMRMGIMEAKDEREN